MCIYPGFLGCLGQVQTYYTCDTWEVTGNAQRALLEHLFFQNLFIWHHVCSPPGMCSHSLPEMWGRYPANSFTEPLPVHQLPRVPVGAVVFPLPLRAAMLKKGSELSGEFVLLLYHETQGKVLRSKHICCASSVGVIFLSCSGQPRCSQAVNLIACTRLFPSVRAMCCQKQPEVLSDPKIKHSLPTMSWLYLNKSVNAGQLLRKCLPVCLMLH